MSFYIICSPGSAVRNSAYLVSRSKIHSVNTTGQSVFCRKFSKFTFKKLFFETFFFEEKTVWVFTTIKRD